MGSQIGKNGVSRRSFLTAAGVAAFGAAGPGMVRRAETWNKPEKRFRVIDTHQHVFNTDLQGNGGLPRYFPESTVEHLIGMMDRGGVDKGYLITYNAEDIASEIRSRGSSPVELLPLANAAYQFKSWEAHKDRFWWFPDHIRPIRETYLEELERRFEKGASGIKLLPIFHGLLPDHRAWHPVYELCRKHRKPIILDLSWWYFGKFPLHNESRARRRLASSFESFADYARILHPIFQEFSSVPFSLAHCGTAGVWEDYKGIFSLIARYPNLSCDLAAILDFSPPFIQQLVKAVGPRKIMYGTDSPYWFKKGQDSYRTGRTRWTMIAEECSFLSDEEKQLLLADNAERFARFEMPDSGR